MWPVSPTRTRWVSQEYVTCAPTLELAHSSVLAHRSGFIAITHKTILWCCFSEESTEIKVVKNNHDLNSFRFLKMEMLKVAPHWWNVLKPNAQIHCHPVDYNIPGLCSSYTVLVLTLDVYLQQVCAYQVTCLNQQCWFTNNTFVTLLTQAGNMICTSCCLVTTCPSLGMS